MDVAPRPRHHLVGLVLLASLLTIPTQAASDEPVQITQEDGFTPLFDGKTTDGWYNPYEWGKVTVEEGELRLTANRKFFLVTRERFGDFVFEGEVKVPDGPANSGFMLRAIVGPNQVIGYQAEVDPSERRWSGGLYDEGRRAWLHPLKDQPQAQAAFDRTTWNHYRIECVGDHIKIYVNGVLTTDYRDPLDQDGPLAVQHHGEKGQTYRFRNLKVKRLGRHGWTPIFDGRSLDGWTIQPGGSWRVEDGVIVGENNAEEPRHGLLVWNQPVEDFTLRLKFRAVRGNSGVYFRSRLVENDPVAIHGFQAEIDSSRDVGGLYETGGRGRVVQPPEELVAKHLKTGDAWNELAISAHGERIVTHLNGQLIIDHCDESARRRGVLALQLHGGQTMRVEFKDLEMLTPVEHAR